MTDKCIHEFVSLGNLYSYQDGTTQFMFYCQHCLTIAPVPVENAHECTFVLMSQAPDNNGHDVATYYCTSCLRQVERIIKSNGTVYDPDMG